MISTLGIETYYYAEHFGESHFVPFKIFATVSFASGGRTELKCWIKRGFWKSIIKLRSLSLWIKIKQNRVTIRVISWETLSENIESMKLIWFFIPDWGIFHQFRKIFKRDSCTNISFVMIQPKYSVLGEAWQIPEGW